MSTSFEEKLDLIEKFPAAVRAAVMAARNPSDMVDVLGTVNSAAGRANEEKRLAASELESGSIGNRWSVEIGRRATRNYNTLALMKDIYNGGVTIMDLIELDVVRIQWQWSNLRKLFDQSETMPKLRITQGDMGDSHVQEDWKDGYPKYTPLTDVKIEGG